MKDKDVREIKLLLVLIMALMVHYEDTRLWAESLVSAWVIAAVVHVWWMNFKEIK